MVKKMGTLTEIIGILRRHNIISRLHRCRYTLVVIRAEALEVIEALSAAGLLVSGSGVVVAIKGCLAGLELRVRLNSIGVKFE